MTFHRLTLETECRRVASDVKLIDLIAIEGVAIDRVVDCAVGAVGNIYLVRGVVNQHRGVGVAMVLDMLQDR